MIIQQHMQETITWLSSSGMKQTKMASAPPLPLALLSIGFCFPDRLSTEHKTVLIRSDREHRMISEEAKNIVERSYHIEDYQVD